MKELIKFASVFFMAATAAACVSETLDDYAEAPEQSQMVVFSADEIETRTVFAERASGSSLPVLWTKNQDVRIFPNKFSQAIVASVTPSKDKKTAKFNGAIQIMSSATSAFYLLSPACAFSKVAIEKTIEVVVPSSQTPTATSPDESAQVLVASTESYHPIPATVSFSPTHLTAYMAISLTNISSVGRSPVVTVTAGTDVALSGKMNYNFETGAMSPVSGSTSNSVSAALPASSSTCFLACLPARVTGGKLKITVKGNAGTLTKTITVPKGKNLTPGTVAVMSVNMNPTVNVTGVSLDKTSLDLNINETAQLTATVTPSNATDKTVSWSSSDTSVATVSSTGLVTAKAEGSATITVTTNSGGKTATCAVNVVNPVTGIEFGVRVNNSSSYKYEPSEDVYHVNKNSSDYLTYYVYYADGSSKYCEGGKLTLVSGSGIEVTGQNSFRCTAAGQTAKLRIHAVSDSSVYSDLTVKTWDLASSIKLKVKYYDGKSMITGWVQENTTAYITVEIEPSTARQKAMITNEINNGNWTVTRRSNTEFAITAPYIWGMTVNDYLQKYLQLTFFCQTGNPSVTQKFTPSNIDLKYPKLFDYITYSASNKQYRIYDGGLRLQFSNTSYCESVSYTPNSVFTPVGVVTEYYPDGIPSQAIASTSGMPTVYHFYESYGSEYSINYTSTVSKGLHGYAIALRDCASDAWSYSFGDVDSSEHWNTNLPARTHYDQSDQDAAINAFNITVAAAYHNGALGSNWCIRPVDKVWRYPDPGYEYYVHAWSTVDPYLMRPWVCPTVHNLETVFSGDRETKLNEKLVELGGTEIYVSSSSHDPYWTVNTKDYSLGYSYNGSSAVASAKNTIYPTRPFMAF